MPKCFVVGCRNGPKKLCLDRSAVFNADIHQIKPRFFYIPKDETSRKTWEKNLPNSEIQLKTTSRVCEEHFVPEDIIKCDETIIDGKVHSIPRQNWKLKIASATSVVPLVQRKPPLERKPLSDITSTYKGFCPSHMKPAKKKERLAAVTKNTVQEIEVGVVESLTVPQLEVLEDDSCHQLFLVYRTTN
ncbi:hypothetical protein OUZ56_012801 [Daphnia magna]|uniref:THAP-type domain-containing protein n=1 Tax=Daphnia magna TaxID=35525 RepID=A0ABQ9Z436_9CRUS|nr:hypothetical protein OUZ56_012801 [Daphnia magna]